MRQGQASLGQAHAQGDRATVHLGRDLTQTSRAVPDGVEARHHGQQSLGGTDVRGRLVATNMLLAGLQRQTVCRGTLGVLGHTHEAARHLSLQGIDAGHKAGVRTAEEQRHTETLSRAHRDVRAQGARGGHQDLGQQVGSDRNQRAGLLRSGDQTAQITDPAGGTRVGDHHTNQRGVPGSGGEIGGSGVLKIDDLDRDACSLRAGLGDGDGLLVEGGVQQNHTTLLGDLGVSPGHELHSLGDGGGFVQQGCTRDRQAGEVLHHGLEIQQRLQTALGNLRLVRGVGGVPARVLHHVAADHRGGDRVVVAVTDELLHRLILRRHHLERGERIGLTQRVGQADRPLLSNGGRKGGLRERCGGLIAQEIQDLLGIAAVGPDVAVDKSCVISSHQAQTFRLWCAYSA